jgi:hypothetical protein
MTDPRKSPVEALNRYGHHDHDCDHADVYSSEPCSCGFNAALQAAMTPGRLQPGDTIGNDRSADMNRVERVIVRGLAAEFGKGKQRQHGDASGFSIAIDGTNVVIDVREEESDAD